MGVEKLAYGAQKMLSSNAGRELIKDTAVAAAPVVVAAAPVVAIAAIGVAAGAGIALLIDKLDNI